MKATEDVSAIYKKMFCWLTDALLKDKLSVHDSMIGPTAIIDWSLYWIEADKEEADEIAYYLFNKL